jgi:hypothetical protein
MLREGGVEVEKSMGFKEQPANHLDIVTYLGNCSGQLIAERNPFGYLAQLPG